MRVGLLTSELTPRHGWGTYSLNLVKALQAQNVDVRIVTASNDAQADYPYLPPLVPEPRFFPLHLLGSLPAVRRQLADCDVVHTTVEYYAPLVRLIAGKRPTFVTIHGSYAHLPNLRRFPIGAWYRRAYQHSTLLCVSNYTAQVVQNIIPDSHTIAIPNGVDASRFAELPPLPQPPTRPTILTAGGVKGRKGTLPLIRAVARVREQIPDVQCIVIGTLSAEPHYVETVRAEIERLNLHDHVQLLGFVDEATLLGWYGAADIFVMPNINQNWKFEGFGLVHLEASAAGLPVIGTDGCGAEDAIEDGVTGYLVSQANVEEELAPAILKVLSDTTLAQQMGQAGKERALRFSWERVAQQVNNTYHAALAMAQIVSG